MMAIIIFEHAVPTVLIWAGLLLALGAAALSFWRFVPKEIPTWLLLALRLLFIPLLVWCLFQPGMKRQLTHLLKPRFVVVLDTSASMQLRPSPDVSNRWVTAQEILRQPWTRAVASQCDVDLYGLGADLGARLGLKDGASLVPDSPATLLRDGLRKISDRYRGQNVAAVVLLSDGIDTREAFDDWTGESWGAPFQTVRLEPKAAWDLEPDVRVDTVNTPRRVSVGWRTELKAVVSGQGTKGNVVNVQLLENDELRQELPAQLPPEGGSREVKFQLDHPKIGSFLYRVRVPPLAGETHTNDNEYSVSVQVIDTKNRLLYVEGPPRWESKFLTWALKGSKQVTPLSFIRGPDNKFMTFGERGTMTPDMQESQLAAFKIVILGNLDAQELGEERARNLAKFVETGGSLVLLGGTKGWSDAGFVKTPLQKLMPIKTQGLTPKEGKYPVRLTEAGQSHPAFAGDPELWKEIPPVLSVFPDVALSAGAQALVTAQTGSGPVPLIAVQRYGQGKVAAILTDSLWRWKLSPHAREKRPYERFWEQLLVWLSPEEKELAPMQLDIFADRDQMFLGEKVQINARMGGKAGEAKQPESVRCLVVTPDKRTIPFAMSKQDVVTPDGKTFAGFSFPFTAQVAGLHTATAETELNGAAVKSDAISFYVKPFTPESVPRPSNTDVLKALAQNSGGRFYEDAEALNDALSKMDFASREEDLVSYSSLWDQVLIIACLMAFLSIEWSIRKWRNMP